MIILFSDSDLISFVEIVDPQNVANMSIVQIINDRLAEAYKKGPQSFLVMNQFTANELMQEVCGCSTSSTILTQFDDLEVLISESLKDHEIRIG